MAKVTVEVEVKNKAAKKEIENLNKSVEKLDDSIKDTNETSSELGGTLDGVSGGAVSGFAAMKASMKGVIGSFKTMRGAIIATGLGALIIAITAIHAAFTTSEEGQNKWAKAMSYISVITGNFMDIISDLGMALIDIFVNPVESLKNFGTSIKEFVMDKVDKLIDGVGLLGSAFGKLFDGDFAGAFNDAADGMISINRAINPVVIAGEALANGLIKTVNATKDLINETNKELILAGKIADMRAKADKSERDLIVDRATANRDRAALLEKAVNKELYTSSQRIEFLKEAGKIEEDITNKEIAAAKLRYDARVIENGLAKSTKADLDEEATLKAKLIELETAKLLKAKEVTSQLQALGAEVKMQADAELAITQAKEDGIDAINKAFKEKRKDEEAETYLEKLDLEEERKIAELDAFGATQEQKQDILDFYAGKRKAHEVEEGEKSKQLEKDVAAAKLNIAKQGLQLIMAVAGNGSKVGKAAAVASATISAIEGTMNAYTSAQKSAITPLFPAYPAIQAGIAAGFGALQVSQILKTKTPNVGGGGGASGGGRAAIMPSAPPDFNVVGAAPENQLAMAIGDQQQKPIQAFVVGSEVTTQQALDRNVVETASLG
tara:strand:- start:5890 stop:7716 length:1827 start_codon:yes stop_codon:yes gene_type:complete